MKGFAVRTSGGQGPALCVEKGFTWTFPRIRDVTVKLKSELIFIKKFSIHLMSLPTPSQSVSHKRFHQCVNHKKKLILRHVLPTFGSFSFFQASL